MKHHQLIPKTLLEKSNKILFVTHLAIGDFTYMQTYFKLFAYKFPHIKIDLWIDEGRRTWRFWRGKNLSNYSLYDWVESCQFFNKIYKETFSPVNFKLSCLQVYKENYPIVISLVTIRPFRYAKFSRRLSPKAFIAGIQYPLKFGRIFKKRMYENLDAALFVKTQKKPSSKHINECFAEWFETLFGLKISSKNRIPFINIPEKYVSMEKLKLFDFFKNNQKKDIEKSLPKQISSTTIPPQLIFINAFAKDKKRCWQINSVHHLISRLKNYQNGATAHFIVNSMPADYSKLYTFFKNPVPNNIYVFSASENFFQLPAIISLCNLVISVETSIIHLASTLNIPTVALMRQKNPEWKPLNKKNSLSIVTKNRSDWVKSITVEQVIIETEVFYNNSIN
jgi:heptosyltransferase III